MFNSERIEASYAKEIRYANKRKDGWMIVDKIIDRNIARLNKLPTQFRIENLDDVLEQVSNANLWIKIQ